MSECPNCEYHKRRAQLWRVEAYRQAGHPLPESANPTPIPVAWMYDFLNPDNRDEVIRDWVTQDYNDIEREKGFNVRPLYTTPPTAPAQVSPLDFVEMVMEKEHLTGKPLIWAQWPNEEPMK